MKLIVETDLGHDPDDFFALCYFIDAGVDLQLITISPGDPDQVAVAKFILNECGLTVPVGVSDTTRTKNSTGSIHTGLLKKYGYPLRATYDGLGNDLMKGVHGAEFFGCGPLDSIGILCRDNLLSPDSHELPYRATIQGGYISYEALAKKGINPEIKIEKFIGNEFVPTFNLNGNVRSGLAFLDSDISEKRFVSKNVCHTIVYDKKVHALVMSEKPKSRAGELLREGMEMYLQKHPEGKKFHDPSAAVCHMHPDIGQWVEGRLTYQKGKWGTVLDQKPNCQIIGKLDYSKLWEHIAFGF